jgi:hypothetical protein
MKARRKPESGQPRTRNTRSTPSEELAALPTAQLDDLERWAQEVANRLLKNELVPEIVQSLAFLKFPHDEAPEIRRELQPVDISPFLFPEYFDEIYSAEIRLSMTDPPFAWVETVYFAALNTALATFGLRIGAPGDDPSAALGMTAQELTDLLSRVAEHKLEQVMAG